jgi:hypothetical protein
MVIFAFLLVFLSIVLFVDRDVFFFAKVKVFKSLEEKEKKAILNTIELHNKILTDFYVSDGNPKLLNEFPASKMLRHYTFRDIGYLQLSNLVLIYDMVEVLPVDIIITGPKTAEAIVLERWNYVYRQRITREIASRVKGIGIGIKYYLKRISDKWIITDYEPIDVEEPPITEFRY